MNGSPQQFSITEAAATRIQAQLAKRGHGLGLRVSVRSSGCSGYSYIIDYADEKQDDDEVFEAHGVQVLVDRASLPLLDGSVMDFRREGLNELFRFDNPHAKALCGCGESFDI